MIAQQFVGKNLVSDDDLDWIPVEEGIRRKIMAYNDAMMLVKVAFEKGRIGAQHCHPHLQMTYVASGAFEVMIGKNTRILRGGDVFYVGEPNVVHGVLCLEEGMLIDVFSPLRADFL
jgi:quercetin dioxygenase-like cupin family protein